MHQQTEQGIIRCALYHKFTFDPHGSSKYDAVLMFSANFACHIIEGCAPNILDGGYGANLLPSGSLLPPAAAALTNDRGTRIR